MFLLGGKVSERGPSGRIVERNLIFSHVWWALLLDVRARPVHVS